MDSAAASSATPRMVHKQPMPTIAAPVSGSGTCETAHRWISWGLSSLCKLPVVILEGCSAEHSGSSAAKAMLVIYLDMTLTQYPSPMLDFDAH